MENSNPIDDLQFIRKLMSETKTTVVDNGVEYIFWGILVAVGLISMYFFFLLDIDLPVLYLWLGIIGAGWVFSAVTGYKRSRRIKVRTFAGNLLGAIWLSAGIAMSMFGFVATTAGAIRGGFVSPSISVVLGMAFFVSSYLHGESWMKWIAVLWWAGAAVMFYNPGLYTVLMMAGMMICLQVLPGIYLYRKYKSEASAK